MMQRDLHAELAEHRQRAESRLVQLCDRSPDICRHFDVASVGNSVCSLWQYRGYTAVPHSISSIWEQIRHQLGEDAVGRFNRMLLCELISTAEDRVLKRQLPESIIQEYVEAFGRVLNKIDEISSAYSDPYDDTALKDLGICSQTMIPAGYCVMDIAGGMVRELFFAGGLRQFLKFFWIYVVRYRHSGPFLFSHFHDEHREKFSPEGRIATFKIIAQLMTARTEFKALVGTAWYLDPEVASISPHLAYVRALPEENGAYFFRGQPEIHRGAFTSKTRRRLYEEGKYVPRPYTMVWPRERLISWASRAVESTNDE